MKTLRTCRLATLAVALALVLPAAHAAGGTYNASALTINGRYDRFIVTYRDGSTERNSRNAAVQNIGAAISRTRINAASGRRTTVAPLGVSYQRKLAVGAELVRTSRKLTQSEASTLMAQIAADPAVAHVEIDALMHPVRDIPATATMRPTALLPGAPNDPMHATYQWHFNNPTGGADVERAWELADGTGITVAVLDTGITQHPDLDLSLADAGYDFINDRFVSGRAVDGRVPGGWDTGDWTTQEPWLSECTSASHPPEDSTWHGTHVSGTIAELTDNGVGMAGVAHNAKVLPVRVLGHCGGYTSDIADGIVWASGGHVDGVPDNLHPAQVINMSLGGGGACSADDVSGQAIAGAISRGATVVVSAGNSNADAANFTPASCPGVITVASSGITGKRAFYSNYGTRVNIAAPGGGVYTDDDPNTGTLANPTGFVWSAINKGTTVPAEAVYGGMAGTSQAAPHVSGAVALILSAEAQAGLPISTPAQIRNLLARTARPFPVKADRPIGTGIVDAYAAVIEALNGGGNESATPLAPGVLQGGQAGASGDSQLYSLNVPAGAKNLTLRSFGGTGDVSLFVKAGIAPGENGSDADFKSTRPGNAEAVLIAKPQATTYYIRVVGVSSYSGLSLLGIYTQ
ncbi:S8 family peptidase [Rhodanobacter umsongensis]|uniref:S8 family peptidase n=1 Tax=Rhodanobacter umsongensis TaxID=633153 RepID=A0ABW0JII7_9GAMM